MFAKDRKKLLNKFLNLVIFVIIIGKAPDLWGFSFSRTENYLKTAREQKLWEQPKWIKLGHYQKKLTGYKSSFRGPFFLNDKGFDSPEAELLTSIQALSPADWAAFTSLSNWVNFSLRAFEISGVAEAGACCAERGTTASRMAPSTRTRLKLHFHPTHFIDMSAPLAVDSTAGDPLLCRPALYASGPALTV